MCKYNPKNQGRRIDPCMRHIIDFLNDNGIVTVSCCCGHGKYPSVIFVETDFPNTYHEIFHDVFIETKARKFFKRDKTGRFFVPEIMKLEEEK